MTDINVKDNIAFVLVPSSFTPPTYYNGVSRKLITNGYENVSGCQLLSACPPHELRRPPAKLEDDALYIREVIQAYLSKGKDVILIMNSYAGFPGTEAIKDLPNRSNLAGGAVVGLIYLSAYLPHAGDSVRSLTGDLLFEPLKFGTPGGYMTMPKEAGQGIFNDWYAEGREKEAEAAFANILNQSSDSFDGKVTNDIWSKQDTFKGKVVYIIGEMDIVVPPSFGQAMVEKVNGLVPGRVRTVRINNAGHVSHVTRPEVVAGIIEDLVGELGNETRNSSSKTPT